MNQKKMATYSKNQKQVKNTENDNFTTPRSVMRKYEH